MNEKQPPSVAKTTSISAIAIVCLTVLGCVAIYKDGSALEVLLAVGGIVGGIVGARVGGSLALAQPEERK